MTPEKLVSMALDAMQHAYAPYSGYKVGAALLCKDGSVVCGANIENAAFEGKRDFAAIAGVGGKDGVASDYFPPCGVCRQVMLEFCEPDFKIYMGKQDGTYLETELRDFMPYGFRASEYMK